MTTQTNPTTVDNPLRRRDRPGRPLWLFGLIVLAMLAVVVGAGALWVQSRLDPGSAVGGMTEVAVRDNAFSPAAVEVPAGTTVTWRWVGEDDHNVVGDGMESPTQSEGEFAREFVDPGSYEYQCTLHFFMRGEVVVTE